jgi:hypothetical protein
VGEWSGKAPDGNSVRYIFHHHGSVENVVEHGEFKLWFGPSGTKSKYVLRQKLQWWGLLRWNAPLWELDMFDYQDFRLKGIVFRAILQPIDSRKFKLQGMPSNHGGRPRKFDDEAIVFEKGGGSRGDSAGIRPPRQSPFIVGRQYRVRQDFKAVRDRFLAGQVLKFEGDAYGSSSRCSGYFFSLSGAEQLRVWDVRDDQDLDIWRELFEEIQQSETHIA